MEKQAFSERVKYVWDNSRLSQQELADLLDVHVKSVQNYIGGKTIPDGEVLERFCREFNLSANWLLLGEGRMSREPEPGPADPRERRFLLRAYQGLRPKRKKLLRGFMAVLRKVQRVDRLQEWVSQAIDGDEYQDLWAVRERFDRKEWEILKAFTDYKAAHTVLKYRIAGEKAGAEDHSDAQKEIQVLNRKLKMAFSEFTSEWDKFLKGKKG